MFLLHENQKEVSIIVDDTVASFCFFKTLKNIAQFMESFESNNCHRHQYDRLSLSECLTNT